MAAGPPPSTSAAIRAISRSRASATLPATASTTCCLPMPPSYRSSDRHLGAKLQRPMDRKCQSGHASGRLQCRRRRRFHRQRHRRYPVAESDYRRRRRVADRQRPMERKRRSRFASGHRLDHRRRWRFHRQRHRRHPLDQFQQRPGPDRYLGTRFQRPMGRQREPRLASGRLSSRRCWQFRRHRHRRHPVAKLKHRRCRRMATRQRQVGGQRRSR